MPVQRINPAIMGGELQMGMTDVNSPQGMMDTGKLKLIAILANQRLPSRPATPLITETVQYGKLVTLWSEPVRTRIAQHRIALIASGGVVDPVALTAKETVTESRWHQPFSEPVRVAMLRPSAEAAGASPIALVQVAETQGKRSRLATEIIKGVILPQFVILPVAVLLVWFALARGIAPLNELQQRIRRRQPSPEQRVGLLGIAQIAGGVDEVVQLPRGVAMKHVAFLLEG